MRFHNFTYLLRQGFKNVVKNKLMSFSSIGVLVACMLLIGISVLFTASINNVASTLQQQTEIVAYLELGVSNTQVEKVSQELAHLENISHITHLTNQDVLKEITEQTGENKRLFEGISPDENPFPHTYILQIGDPSLTENTVKKVLSIDGVEEVKASLEEAELLGEIKELVYYAGFIIVAILIIVSLAIITNTIKITIFSRRREINIMKYVGATDMFIRLPFLIEGMVIGLLAAIFSFVILGVGYSYLIEWTGENYGTMFTAIIANAVAFKDLATEIMCGFIAIGVGIGMVSSGIFVRKHLRV